MLTKIRERASGWIAWVIVVLITIPFALWGIQSYFEGPTEAPVATVNGEEIPLYAYQNELSRRRQALLSQSDGNVDTAFLESAEMRNAAVEAMISARLMNQYVRERDYRLSDELLKLRIESDPVFFRDERFDPALYRDLLRSNGFTPQTYEAGERQNAAIEQLSAAVAGSSFVTEPEMSRLLALQTQTRSTDYVILPAARFEAEIEIDEDAISREYEDNPSAYQAPARVKVDYIELSVDELAKGIEPSEAEVGEIYQQTSERYKQAEIRKASHILFGVDAPADGDASAEPDELQEDEIRTLAETVLAEARGGADFAELAQQHSDDPGSKERGGDLGVVARGQMVKPFEDAVFDMTEGEIRGPVKTRFGYHIIKLTELTEERQKTLDEVREEVVAEAARVQAENLFAEQNEAFRNLVFEDPESLTAAANELGLEIRQTDWFTENHGDGPAAEAAVRRAAFSEDVLTDELNSAAIELGFDRMVAIHKAGHEDAHIKPLEEVRDDIEQRLKSRESQRKTRELGDQLSADLGAGQLDWQGMLAQQELESEALAEQRDQVPGNLTELGDAVFSHAPPDSGSAAYGGISLANGDYALYALKEVSRGDDADIDETRRDELRRRLLARDGDALYQQFRTTLRMKADIAINREQVQNPAAAYQ